MTNSNQAASQSTGGLVVQGIGYVNAIEWRTSKDGKQFLACKVAAMIGTQQYVYFSCVVNGDDAKSHIERCIEACEAENKILIRFKMSINNIFAYQKNDGELDATLNSSLFDISYIKIENQVVFQKVSHENEAPNPVAAPAVNKGHRPQSQTGSRGNGRTHGKNNRGSGNRNYQQRPQNQAGNEDRQNYQGNSNYAGNY